MEAGDSSLFLDVKNFLLENNFRNVMPLGKGGFGEVLSAVSPNKEHVAVKIIKNERSWPIEEKIWPLLRHDNILTLLNVIDVESLDLKLYIMPRHPYVLDKVMRNTSFLTDENGLLRIKRWLSGALKGLEYLHDLGFAHTDIKSDNVLITSDDRAILCDFSGLNFTIKPLKRLCAPKVFRPPDCYDAVRCKTIDACAYDMWLFGMMCLNVLTGDWPILRMKSVTDAESWKKNIEPLLIEALEKKKFFDLMKRAFPAVYLPEKEIFLAHDFVVSMMQWDQKDRPSVKEIQRHRFLSSSQNQGTKKSESISSKEVQKITTNPFIKDGTDTGNTKEINIGHHPVIECSDKKTALKNNDHHGKKSKKMQEKSKNLSNKTNENKVKITNPFLEGWLDPEENCDRVLDKLPESQNLEEIILSDSKDYIQNTETTEKDKVMPIFERMSVERAQAKRNGARKIKDWLKYMWNKNFKKNYKYKLLKDESE